MSTRAGIWMAAVAVVALGTFVGVAAADEIEAEEVIVGEEVAPPPAEPPAEKPCCTIWPLGYVDRTFDDIVGWWAKPNRQLVIGSGLSTAFQWDFNDPSNDKIPFRFATNESSYDVELWQFNLGYNLEPDPGTFGFNVVFDAGRLARKVKTDWNGSGVVPDTYFEHTSMELQEAYLHYNVDVGNGLLVKGGKFNKLVGNENIEPWNNHTFSRSYMFTFGEPYTHTGGLLSYPVTEMVKIAAGGVIGWDQFYDNNAEPAGIAQIALDPSEYADLRVSGIFGPEQTCSPKPGQLPTLQGQGCNSNQRGLVDVVLGVNPIEDVGMSFNFAWASESEASLVNPGRHAQWIGASGTIWYDFLDCFEVATRGEWFQDQQGVRLGAVAPGPGGIPQLTGATVWAVTFDAKADISEHIYVRTEYRYDGSPQQIFAATNSFNQNVLWRGQNTVSVELGYSF